VCVCVCIGRRKSMCPTFRGGGDGITRPVLCRRRRRRHVQYTHAHVYNRIRSFARAVRSANRPGTRFRISRVYMCSTGSSANGRANAVKRRPRRRIGRVESNSTVGSINARGTRARSLFYTDADEFSVFKRLKTIPYRSFTKRMYASHYFGLRLPPPSSSTIVLAIRERLETYSCSRAPVMGGPSSRSLPFFRVRTHDTRSFDGIKQT